MVDRDNAVLPDADALSQLHVAVVIRIGYYYYVDDWCGISNAMRAIRSIDRSIERPTLLCIRHPLPMIDIIHMDDYLLACMYVCVCVCL